MYEVELKVRAEHGPVRERLAELDADRLEDVHQADTYYDAPHREFTRTDEALRLREQRGTETVHELTYKGPKVDDQSKTREEHETRVGDPGAADAALRALGFAPAGTVEKDRERYALGEYTVTLDEVAGLGEFVEVEGSADREGIEAVRRGAADLLSELGLDPEDGIRTSYLGLLVEGEDGEE